MKRLALFGLLLLCVAASVAFGAVPQIMSYQGRLTDGSGKPVADGACNVRFSLYDQATAGNLLWMEPAITDPARQVTVSGGVFSVLIGSLVPLPESAFQGNAFLQVEANGSTLLPRTQIVSVGFAIHALSADKIPDGSVTSVKLASASVTNAKIARGAVTPDKLNIETATRRGQVLTFDGEMANWLDPVPLALPWSGTTSSSATALGVTNSGTGKAGSFSVTNAASAAAALSASTAGTGRAGDFSIANIASSANALGVSGNGSGAVLDSLSTGTGRAGSFRVSNSASVTAALYGTTNGSASSTAIYASNTGLGESMYVEINNALNSKPALDVYTNGTGVGGIFTAGNAANTMPALQASHQGTGPALQAGGESGNAISSWARGSEPTIEAWAYGTGRAGHFEVTNYASNAATVYATSTGTGPVVYAQSTGMGEPGHFEVKNANSGSSAIYAASNGKSPTLNISNSGLNEAGHFEVTNSASGYSAIYAKTVGSAAAISAKAGTGKAALLDGDVQINGKVSSSAVGGYLPVAFGRVDSNGDKLSGTANFGSARYYEGIYAINFTGFSYNDSDYTAIVTANVTTSLGLRIATAYRRTDGAMGVLIQDGGGCKDCPFSFVVYGKP